MSVRPIRSNILNHSSKSQESESLEPEATIIVGVGLKSDDLSEMKESLLELEELVFTAGGKVVASFTQVLDKYIPATLMGSGKVLEIKTAVEESDIELVVVDHTLNGVQLRNLETQLGVRVLDRSQLILDIFAQRAQSFEGKLQVELAQMMDQLPRMVGGWLGSLSRQGGGIGTRGPGETALEIDRRRIREKMKIIKKKLEQVSQTRNQHRSKRQRSAVPSFALIGYTNAGKSTLLNQLTRSDVLAEDLLFATLDPTTRKLFLPSKGHSLITDTVGFIRKLPTQLIEAFKATLEESAQADVLLHIIDLSSPNMDQQIETVNNLILELGWSGKPIIHVFNKMDTASADRQFKVNAHPRVFISAKTGEGLDKLKQLMCETLDLISKEVELYFEKQYEHLIYDLARQTDIRSQENSRHGTLCKAKLTDTQIQEWSEFLHKPEPRN